VAGGWIRYGAILDQSHDKVVDGVLTARARMSTGPGGEFCLERRDPIPEARRRAMPGAVTSISRQPDRDWRIGTVGFNQRETGDRQLRQGRSSRRHGLNGVRR